MDCSSPGSSVHGVFQARVLEWLPVPPLGTRFRKCDAVVSGPGGVPPDRARCPHTHLHSPPPTPPRGRVLLPRKTPLPSWSPDPLTSHRHSRRPCPDPVSPLAAAAPRTVATDHTRPLEDAGRVTHCGCRTLGAKRDVPCLIDNFCTDYGLK